MVKAPLAPRLLAEINQHANNASINSPAMDMIMAMAIVALFERPCCPVHGNAGSQGVPLGATAAYAPGARVV